MSVKKLNDPLSTLLADLPIVRERGFTQGVLYRVQLRLLRRRVFLFTAWCCGIVAIALSLILGRFGATLSTRLQESSSLWTDFAKLDQITPSLISHLQWSNFNAVIGLSVGALVLVLGISSLLRD